MQKFENIDVGLLLKLQNKVKDLEREKAKLNECIERYEEEGSQMGGINTDSAFDALKVDRMAFMTYLFIRSSLSPHFPLSPSPIIIVDALKAHAPTITVAFAPESHENLQGVQEMG